MLQEVPCFVIHRSQDVGREPILRELEKDLRISLNVVEPLNGQEILDQGFPTRHPIELNPTRPEVVSLCATHVKLLRKALEDKTPVVAIFEDDARFLKPVDAFLADLPADWDLAFLGVRSIVQKETHSNYYKVRRSYGTHALLIRQKAIPKILESYEQSIKNKYAIPSDWLYSGATKVHGLHAYAPLENLVGWVTGIPNTLNPGTIRYD